MGVVARAVSVGARDKAASLEALDSFQSTAMAKLAKHVSACPPVRSSCNALCPDGAILQDPQSSCLRPHDHYEQLSQSFLRHVTMSCLQSDARCAHALPSTNVFPALRQLTSAHVQAEALRGLSHGDIQAALLLALSKASSIRAPVFFAQNTDLFQNYISPIHFAFSGVSVSPCAVLISPVGVGFFPEVCQFALFDIATMSRGLRLHILESACNLCMSI